MEEIVKHINDTNASYRALNAGDAKNTDLFLDNEHFELFKNAGERITVRFNKENLQKAILFIASILPRKYDNSSVHKTIPFSSAFVLDQLAFLDAFFTIDGKRVESRTQVWNARKDVEKKNGEIDNRFYFNGLLEDVTYKSFGGELKTAKFTIRNYVAGGYSDLHIKRAKDGAFDIWVTNVQTPYDDGKEKGHEILETASTPAPNVNYTEITLSYLTALRTKPFMLLAGISGTGKSRIVRKLAQASVTEELQRQYDPKSVAGGFNRWGLHKPANYELIQVKPNWHNSLEVVGYKSNIGGAHYEFTPFVEFVARAWKHPDVPFFLCLDEMNLAPVEQYFAEFLSAIESRSIENGEYETDPIVKPFESFNTRNDEGVVIDNLSDRMIAHLVGKLDTQRKSEIAERMRTKGLTLPKNLLVMGTVNMDETTFSFSRKVLDRAMSVVMNEVEYDKFFNGESEKDVEEMDENTRKLLIDRPIRGLEAEDNEAEEVQKYLTSINEKLNDTPFKLGYRAANEALLYVSAARHFNPDADLRTALDEFTMMKILSRIEGDKRSIGSLLEDLKEVITTDYPKSNEKLGKMAETLKNKQFVSYWT